MIEFPLSLEFHLNRHKRSALMPCGLANLVQGGRCLPPYTLLPSSSITRLPLTSLAAAAAAMTALFIRDHAVPIVRALEIEDHWDSVSPLSPPSSPWPAHPPLDPRTDPARDLYKDQKQVVTVEVETASCCSLLTETQSVKESDFTHTVRAMRMDVLRHTCSVFKKGSEVNSPQDRKDGYLYN